MTFTFRPIDDISAADWDDLVQSSPDGWVFGLHGWQRLVDEVEPWGFVDHGFGIEENGRLVAVMPLHLQPSSNVAGSSGWGGCGPMISGDLTAGVRQRVFKATMARSIEIAKDQGAVRLDTSCSPVTESSLGNRWAINPFVLEGLDDCSLMSQVISLTPSEEQLWRGLSQIARRHIRHAENAGYRVEQVDWQASLDTYYDIHVETYERTGVSPHPRSYFSGISTRIAPSKSSRLHALISPGGEPLGFNNTIQFGKGAYYHTGCSRTAVQAISPGYLLMWEALKAAKAEGFTWYDVGWIFPNTRNEKQQGLTLFKTRFGGEPHRAFRSELTIAQSEPPALTAAADAQADKPVCRSGPMARARTAAHKIVSRAAGIIEPKVNR